MNELIQLTMPVDAAYVSAARMTATSIANRMGFDINEIEDIKAAVSEACTLMIKHSAQNAQGAFTIVFSIEKDLLNVTIDTENVAQLRDSPEEMGLVMMKALMDDLNVDRGKDGRLIVKMTKQRKLLDLEP